ncbi:MAG: hypothetical protein FWG84_10145 [Bacteroidales bacterium]|nr:hypothetical protein [Bacteroidales bacterium]
MRKLLLFMALFMSFVLTAQAGYVIRSINITADLEYFHNFTLTINGANEPISAGSMVLPATEENGIVIIQTDSNEPAYFFPVLLNEGNLFIQVRDFHYVDNSGSGYYVLCGSRGEGSNARAFVATVDVSLSWMDFYEYADANVFYSIWAENLLPPYPAVDDYYVCGAKDSFGVIASIDRASMQFTDFRSTITGIGWECHKIILKKNTDHTLLFVVSGRNPDRPQIGVTTFTPPFNTLVSYAWYQYTEPDSHCVVSADLLTDNSVILASSHQDKVTLNPITFPPLSIDVYQFDFPNPTNTYLIQDIETCISVGGAVSPLLSVAGYTESPPPCSE